MQNEHAQIATTTAPARYEKLFRKTLTASDWEPDKQPRILSFGCSIGDEIPTIFGYFPHADIFGCDLNPAALNIAQSTVGHLATIFEATYENIAKNGPYDIIFALSVLCMVPPPKNFIEAFPFSKFENLLSILDMNLNDGGLLVIKNSSYFFTSSSISNNYAIIRDGTTILGMMGGLFSKDGDPIFRTKSSGSKPFKALPTDLSELSDEFSVCDDLFKKGRNPEKGRSHIITVESPMTHIDDLEVICSWQRSNFDGHPRENLKNLLENRFHYTLVRDPVSGRKMFKGKASRSCFFSDGYVETREELYPVASWLLDSPL